MTYRKTIANARYLPKVRILLHKKKEKNKPFPASSKIVC